MKKRQPLSIRHTLWLAIALTVASTVLATGALSGYRLYRQTRRAEQLQAYSIAETYAAQVAPFLLTDRKQELTTFVEQLDWHPSTRLLAILNIHQKPLALRGTTDLLERYRELILTRRDDAGLSAWRIPAEPDRGRPAFTLAATAIRPLGSDESFGTLVYAAIATNQTPITVDTIRTFLIYPILIAATGMVLGFLWLKRKVLDPLALLSHQSRKPKLHNTHADLPVGRQDEIGDLARTLNTMRVDLEEWHLRAAQLERSFTVRVARETERITRELKQVQKKSWTDPLTTLDNRRLLDEKFAEIFNAQRDSDKDISIVMMDMDNFKALNDTLGHQSGDELLQFFGELLRQCLREQDLAVRYGGDEFLLILPSVPARDAQIIADRTIALFAQQAKLLPVDPQPSISAGIASLHAHQPDSAEQLLQLSDAALYQAKAGGKGRSAIYEPPPGHGTAKQRFPSEPVPAALPRRGNGR